MNDELSVGFIGFGEAGFEIARGLHTEGIDRIFFFDIISQDADRVSFLRERSQEAGARSLESARELIEQSDIIFSVVPPAASITVGMEAANYLKTGKFYVDLTSSFPDDMKTINERVEPTGAKFVDGAMMGALPVHRHKVLIYLAGSNAEDVADILNEHGMNIRIAGAEPGQASAIKLILSIVTKGFGALVHEMFLAAHYYDVEEKVLFALNQFYAKGLPPSDNRSITRNAIHAQRRVKEMVSSKRLMENIGIDPIMTRATVQRLEWVASLNLSEYFGGVVPEHYEEVIRAWEKKGVTPKRNGKNG